jgi:hypothetical protein
MKMQLDDGIKLVIRLSQLEIPVGKEMVAWIFMQYLRQPGRQQCCGRKYL